MATNNIGAQTDLIVDLTRTNAIDGLNEIPALDFPRANAIGGLAEITVTLLLSSNGPIEDATFTAEGSGSQNGAIYDYTLEAVLPPAANGPTYDALIDQIVVAHSGPVDDENTIAAPSTSLGSRTIHSASKLPSSSLGTCYRFATSKAPTSVLGARYAHVAIAQVPIDIVPLVGSAFSPRRSGAIASPDVITTDSRPDTMPLNRTVN